MSNLKLLIKNNINSFVGTFQNKTKNKSTTTALILLIIGSLALLAIYALQANSMFLELGKQLGFYELCMFHSFTTTLSVCLIIGFMRVSDKQKTNDTDLLLSLPIRKIDIIISKTFSKYLFDFALIFILYVPYIVLYQVYTGFSLYITLVGLAYQFLLPFLSIGISYIWSFIVTHVFNKTKFAGFLKSTLTLIIFVLIIGLLLIKTYSYGLVKIETLADYFADRPITNVFLQAVVYKKAVYNVFLLCLISIPAIIGLMLYYKTFGKTYMSYTSKDENLKIVANNNSFASMFRKELYYFCNTPAYLINTMIGPVLSLVLSIIVLIMGESGLSFLFGGMLPNGILSAIVVLILCGCSALTTISSSSISLEGKSFWILKSSPISEKTLFLSKAMLNVCLLCPFTIISAILFTIALKLSFITMLLCILLPTLLGLIISFGGVLINIYLPKLKWDNETTVVKQSMSVLLTMILGMLLTALPVGINYLFENLSLRYVALISAGLYAVALTIIIAILFTKGVKIFRKIKY